MKKTIFISGLVLLLTLTIACVRKKDEAPQIQEDNITKIQMQTSPKAGDKIAILKTNYGEIKILLYTDQVPETTKNFIEISNSGKYNGTIFHRVIEDFMVQGGDFENKDGLGGYSYQGPGTTIKDEFIEGLNHIYGAVSMANTGMPNSGGSQFFIVQKKGGTHWLDGKHTVFGFVYDGMNAVEKIAQTQTDANDKPLDEVKLDSVEITTF